MLDIGCGAGDLTSDVLAPTVEDSCSPAAAGASGAGNGGGKGSGKKHSGGGGGGSGGGGGGGGKGGRVRRRSQVVGVDVSAQMVEHARERRGLLLPLMLML